MRNVLPPRTIPSLDLLRSRTWSAATPAISATIPIVFTGGQDPVKLGLVQSLSRPGGNATGVLNIAPVLTAKRLELLRELVPTADVIAVLANPTATGSDEQLTELKAAADSLGQKIETESRAAANISYDRNRWLLCARRQRPYSRRSVAKPIDEFASSYVSHEEDRTSRNERLS